ncbi:hypothetical protein H9Y04_22765 [Streptomyces sp. TRM66268-LWL]|uniref:Integral membrane protein n=1 Tax=Streptomyces polyasparticus TaxID=2767826 RepID=A0ABR7SKY6_9ACTN|nr:hypothetical protein [Streptomyces polyasparticus]MBC9715375.1 hypothetical protein [Streptomyces polyasparticus]
MSITSPIPVLRAADGTQLRLDGDALLLHRKTEELRIPLAAIARLHIEGRSLAVGLTAAAGAVPVVHRVEDVSEAAAKLFAEAVDALLPEPRDGTDGSALVTVRAITESPREKDRRRRRILTAVIAFVCLVLAVAVGLHGEWSLVPAIVLVGPVGGFLTVVGADLARLEYLAWQLPRHGVTVEAGQAGETRILGGAFRVFVYTDLHGVHRSVYDRSRSATLQVAYRPDRPDIVTVCTSRAARVRGAGAALAVLFFGLLVTAATVTVAVGAFLGWYPEY